MEDISKIRIKRAESLLLEVVNEAISSLQDSRINSLSAVSISCSKGKYCADVFLDASSVDEQEKREILKNIKKANGFIKEYVLSSTGWFRCPNFNFAFDATLANSNKLDEIFDKIAKERD